MNPTASSLTRALNCPGSFALPQVDEEESIFAARGHGVHDFIVQARALGRDEALALIPEDAPHRQFCEQLPIDELPQGGYVELAVAWNMKTDATRMLGSNIGRDYRNPRYAVSDDEIVGTIDLYGTADGWVIVIDWKTGFRMLGAPAGSDQLLFGALAGARLAGLERARMAFFYLNDEGEVRPRWGAVDALDLADFADRLRELPQRIAVARADVRAGRTPEIKGGSWCTHCPAKRGCPVRAGQVRSFAHELGIVTSPTVSITPAQGGALYDRLGTWIDIAEALRDELKEIARVVPLELPNGKVLKEVPTKLPTTVKPEIAEGVIAELHGPAIAGKAVTLEKVTSITAITDALRPIAKPRQLGSLVDKTLAAIRHKRGLVEGTTRRVREVKP